MITSGQISYLRLDKKTISPIEILEYFLENGYSSHKDVYLLHNVTNTKHNFFLISRKATYDIYSEINSFAPSEHFTNMFCYRKTGPENSWQMSTNFLAVGKQTIKDISRFFS
jgi:hypothetical protein